MLQMAAVFAELGRGMIRERVMAGLERAKAAKAQGVTLGRPKVARKVENAIRTRLARGEGILKVAKGLGVGVSTCSGSRRRTRLASEGR
jgi:DNA invertase Pin-like site-specific DNA recombinase